MGNRQYLKLQNTFGAHTIDLTAVATRDSRITGSDKLSGTDFAANGNTTLGINGLFKATTQKSLKTDKRPEILVISYAVPIHSMTNIS